MRLPNSAHTSRPWRIHEFTRDFRLEDVWAALTLKKGTYRFYCTVHPTITGTFKVT
jgi:hypothetical protein